MSASPSSAASAAIVSHILDAIDRNSDKELGIALLIRDAIDEVALHIMRRFVGALSGRLSELHPGMEKLKGELSAKRYSGIGWRHEAWPRGVSIRLEFQSEDYCRPSFGVCAPSAATLEGEDEGTLMQYVPISEELRQRIAGAVSSGSSFLAKGKWSGWWPVYADLPPPLDYWLNEEALRRVAGTATHEGTALVEWMCRQFGDVRNALRPVLG